MKILKLNDDTQIEVFDSSTLFDIQVDVSKYNDMWETLTQKNLKKVALYDTTTDAIMEEKLDLVVDYEQSERDGEKISCHFYLRERDRVEVLEEQVEYLTAQLSVHDGAIMDLGDAVSALEE